MIVDISDISYSNTINNQASTIIDSDILSIDIKNQSVTMPTQ